MIETPEYRIFFHSPMYGKNFLCPVYSINTTYRNKKNIETVVTIKRGKDRRPHLPIPLDLNLTSPCILMRKSDIPDKSGKLIYDGDVLQWGTDEEPDHTRAIVYFRKGVFSASYYSKIPDSCKVERDIPIEANAWWGEGWEPNLLNLLEGKGKKQRIHYDVIGNICENPELLGYEPQDLEGISSVYYLGHEDKG